MVLLSNLVAAPGVPIQTLVSARDIPDENLGDFDKRETGLGIFCDRLRRSSHKRLQVLQKAGSALLIERDYNQPPLNPAFRKPSEM